MNKSYYKSGIKRIVFSFLIFLTIIFCFMFALKLVGKKTDNERLKIMKNAVVRAAVSCYAMEGVYPPELEYLEENYGLSINHEKYFVSYQAFSSNVMPDIDVFLLNEVNTYAGK